MKLLPTLGLALAGVFILSKLTTATAASRINFAVGSVSLSNQGLTPIVNITVLAQNPTNSSISVNSIIGTLAVNGSQVGNLTGFVPVVILPNAQTQIPLTVSLQGLSLFSDIASILGGTAGHAVVTMTGTANIDNLLLPLNITYNIF